MLLLGILMTLGSLFLLNTGIGMMNQNSFNYEALKKQLSENQIYLSGRMLVVHSIGLLVAGIFAIIAGLLGDDSIAGYGFIIGFFLSISAMMAFIPRIRRDDDTKPFNRDNETNNASNPLNDD